MDRPSTVESIDFARPFQLWGYQVGHRQLLLRSVMANERSTRIDVLFKAVSAMLVHPSYAALSIRPPSVDEASQIAPAVGPQQPTAGTGVHVLQASPLSFVISGAAYWGEDTGDYSTPSSLASWNGPTTGLLLSSSVYLERDPEPACDATLDAGHGRTHFCTRPAEHNGQHYSFSRSGSAGGDAYEVVWPPPSDATMDLMHGS